MKILYSAKDVENNRSCTVHAFAPYMDKQFAMNSPEKESNVVVCGESFFHISMRRGIPAVISVAVAVIVALHESFLRS